MSFEHAPVTKALMIGSALTSIVVGIFDTKHYLHLQLVPHISRYHQYWRLFVHHLAFSSSSDLFVAELVLYNVAVQIERQFGSVKFASFAVVSTLVNTILEFLSLLLFHRVGLNYIPSGPSALLFSILYQYYRIVPSSYKFRIFGVPLTNKVFVYILALQLAISRLPGSAAVAIIGILTGQIYRSDLANIKSYRLPPTLVHLSARFLLPLIGSTRAARRSNRALPDHPRTPSPGGTGTAQTQNDEVVTTARPTPSAGGRSENASEGGSRPRSSVMREWVNELTTGGIEHTGASGLRVPGETEITTLMSMFPNIGREVIVAALQRSPNAEGAVETLLVT